MSSEITDEAFKRVDRRMREVLKSYGYPPNNDLIAQLVAAADPLITSQKAIWESRARLDEQKAVTEWLTDAEHVETVRDFNRLRRIKLEAQLSTEDVKES